jgi:murein L,D-transpeptidase YcbB/YkuD
MALSGQSAEAQSLHWRLQRHVSRSKRSQLLDAGLGLVVAAYDYWLSESYADRQQLILPDPLHLAATRRQQINGLVDAEALAAFFQEWLDLESLPRLNSAVEQLQQAGYQPWHPLGQQWAVLAADGSSESHAIRDRLQQLGDWPSGAEGDQLDEAVRYFQRRHGLHVDGVIGPKTLAWLDVDPQQRVRALASDWLRRWVQIPQVAVDRIVVNIPDFQLQYWRDDALVMASRVVVGRSDRPTPLIEETITGLIINPKWHVPLKIMREDVLPQLRHRPDYLQRRGIQVMTRWRGGARVDEAEIDWQAVDVDRFPYRLVQQQGPLNALGRVKFNMPNPDNVFLHHTANAALFDRNQRAYSSGCVRVEKARLLAQDLLEGQGWSAVSWWVKEWQGETEYIPLHNPIAVYLIYQTAWVDRYGVSHFRDDLYGWNRPLGGRLQQKLLAAAQK